MFVTAPLILLITASAMVSTDLGDLLTKAPNTKKRTLSYTLTRQLQHPPQ